MVDGGELHQVTLIRDLMDEKLHNVGGIGRTLPLHHGIVELLKDEVHNINGAFLFLTIVEHLIGVIEEVDQSTANSIIVPSTWQNVASEGAEEDVIEWKKILGETRSSTMS